MIPTLVLVLAVASATPEQTFFYSEGAIRRPVPIPQAVLEPLLKQRGGDVAQCLADKQLPESATRSFFAASALDLNHDGHADLVVTAGRYCLQGAHATPFWLFLKTPVGYALVFDSILDELEIQKTTTRGMRDIVTVAHTAISASYHLQKWDGSAYRADRCWSVHLPTGKRTDEKCP